MEIFKEERKHLVYKHTSPSGKCYIGITKDYELRCIQHKSSNNECVAFRNALEKYGWDNFTHEILEEKLTLQEANDKEKYYIGYYNSLSPSGYNLTTGGDTFELSEETKEKMRGKYRGSTTGHANIRKLKNSYSVSYLVDGVTVRLGNYNTLEDALEAKRLQKRTNRAIIKITNTGIAGIYLRNGKYTVKINIDGKNKNIGVYNTLDEALEAKSLQCKTNRAIEKISNTGVECIHLRKDNVYAVRVRVDGKILNLGHYNTLDDAIEAKLLFKKTEKVTNVVSNTGIVGIYRRGDKFDVKITVEGKSKNIGVYNNIEDAIEAKELGCATSKSNSIKENKLGLPGINKIGNSYRVTIRVNGKEKSIGRYSNLEDAVEAKSLNQRTPKANAIGRKPKSQQHVESSEIKLKD